MNKSELIEALSVDQKFHMTTAEGIVNTIIDSMVETLVAGDNIEIRGFGSFKIKNYESFEGKNPKTGEKVFVPAKKLPVFKPGKDLKESVDNAGKKSEKVKLRFEGLSHNEKVQMEEYIPQEFKFTIGGFFSDNCIIEFKDNKLAHGFSNAWDKSNLYSRNEVIPTPSAWNKFWTKVEKIQVWKWKKEYIDPDILDGEQWSLKIKKQNKTLNVYGLNSYPETFNQFKKAISKLLGGLSLGDE